MQEAKIYQDIAKRNNGDVYIGVVGPVRTGKSTFIKKFMDTLVIPNMENTYQAERTRDELPQSAAGKTIMTTEPKFIPEEAIEISPAENASMRVRMIDCVGYVVDDSIGYNEDGEPRMVNTPWFDHPIPFNDAAEIGTKKVITDHSTIGLVVTTDGSFSDIPRENYISAETRVIAELKSISKPFIVLLNSAYPNAPQTQKLREELEAAYGVSVVAICCTELTEDDINQIINEILMEFPLSEIRIQMPGWIERLGRDHEFVMEVYKSIGEAVDEAENVKDIKKIKNNLSNYEFVKSTEIKSIDLSSGAVQLRLEITEDMFYKAISEFSGIQINNEEMLLNELASLSAVKKDYEHIKIALDSVRETGYGIVSPTSEEMELEEPQVIKQGGRYGIKLKANAPSIHMLRANIATEVSPIVGTVSQSEELVEHLLEVYKNNPSDLWESNIFGKTLNELVNDGLKNKLDNMPDQARAKLRETIERIINEGGGGLLCFIL